MSGSGSKYEVRTHQFPHANPRTTPPTIIDHRLVRADERALLAHPLKRGCGLQRRDGTKSPATLLVLISRRLVNPGWRTMTTIRHPRAAADGKAEGPVHLIRLPISDLHHQAMRYSWPSQPFVHTYVSGRAERGGSCREAAAAPLQNMMPNTQSRLLVHLSCKAPTGRKCISLPALPTCPTRTSGHAVGPLRSTQHIHLLRHRRIRHDSLCLSAPSASQLDSASQAPCRPPQPLTPCTRPLVSRSPLDALPAACLRQGALGNGPRRSSTPPGPT